MNIESKERVLQINMGQVPQGYKKLKDNIIPIDWKVKYLKDITFKIIDGTHSTPKYTESGVQFYSVENVENNNFQNTKFISEEDHIQLSKRCPVKKGDILMTRIGSIGNTKMIDWDVKASIYVSLALIKPNHKVLSEYIYSYSKSQRFIREVLSKSLLNATPQKINLGDISKLKIIVPDNRSEQQKIAEILLTCDKVIELKEKLIEQNKFQKKYFMQALLDPKSPNFRQLIGFKDEWKEVKLGDFIYETKDLTIIQNQYRLLTSSKNGIVLQEDYFNKIVSSDENIGYKIIKKGEFTFRCMSDTGFFKINRLEGFEIGIVSPAYNVFNIRKADSDFMSFFLNSYKMIYKYSTIAQGGTRLALKIRSLAKLNVTIPNLEEQTAIAKILSTADQEIEFLEKELEQQKLKKKALMQLLLTGKVRVNVS